MSSDVFKYFVNADCHQQQALQVEISSDVQDVWKQRQLSKEVTKFDDLGDALLHALNDILCGSSQYRALVSTAPSLHVNRSVVVAVFPSNVYWVVIQCTWNLFTVEFFGSFSSNLDNGQRYKSHETVEHIKENFDPLLLKALTEVTESELYAPVSHIKMIVKQLKGDVNQSLSNVAAGALTNATVDALKSICDEVAPASRLCTKNQKGEDWTYTRTLPTGTKYQILRSSGKHTNAVVTCLEWMKEQAPLFVKNRPLYMSRQDKLAFFSSLYDLSKSNNYQMEMIRLSEKTAMLLSCNQFLDDQTRIILADLILIGLNKNSHFVGARADSYRQTASKR